ncbi:MAG: alpha/beta hydrolase [Clostridia bacterium]|nr:alpha/beta hydrolase [Clostridia bacterium]
MWLFETKEGVATFILCLLLAVALFAVFSSLLVSHFLFVLQLKRTKKTKWARECSKKEPTQLKMYEEGVAWSKKNQAYKKDVHVVNDGLNLYGEYYDFGFDRVVIFVAGRTEGLGYGYYFAAPYRGLGFNVLTIDARAHGESDGTYNTVGFEEHKDLLVWAKFLHEEYGVKSIILHGICIGSSCSLFALTSENCPPYIDGLIAEGMYPNFYESFKNHMTSDYHQPAWPVMPLVRAWMKRYTGHDMRYGNIDVIDKLQKPLLMIHSKEDRYSLPSEAEKLYAKCPHDKKTIVWFERGAHSKLRPTDPERYDEAVAQFLTTYFPKKND